VVERQGPIEPVSAARTGDQVPVAVAEVTAATAPVYAELARTAVLEHCRRAGLPKPRRELLLVGYWVQEEGRDPKKRVTLSLLTDPSFTASAALRRKTLNCGELKSWLGVQVVQTHL
jgi:hypothetical protein